MSAMNMNTNILRIILCRIIFYRTGQETFCFFVFGDLVAVSSGILRKRNQLSFADISLVVSWKAGNLIQSFHLETLLNCEGTKFSISLAKQ